MPVPGLVRGRIRCPGITDGILRCRYRDSFSDPELMTPGKTYEITVEAPDTANLFLADPVCPRP
ncbi:hypothetical protein OG604_29740 [Streptomyces sp. NBC_01231]|nr:hypothetical protein OG604_29740 [Streptomyces sp. NBC_01231]